MHSGLACRTHFLRPGDIVTTETGTSSADGRELFPPENTLFVNSSIWLSSGFMLPAAQGACLSQRHLQTQGPTILFEGDGSFQVTAQELSAIIRKRLDIIVFLTNNNGFNIERLIHGCDAENNEVALSRYLESLRCYGVPTDGSYEAQTAKVETWGQLHALLADGNFQAGFGGGRAGQTLTPRNIQAY
ncbi:hypothetical protein N7519_007279 [Penicillium mononematosum]|uniref:uncharacterized protein n=1 Tax=Penicillium mononematosum TaxID=268346 RepID=UPI002547ED91|nr:uncharacterized protein N7519_007279 [Penicillium mononematosum]KAJ6185978.1 hypothetical protein N7519_007279 [Penicillium mononematosum]